jgi:hypothetical protein
MSVPKRYETLEDISRAVTSGEITADNYGHKLTYKEIFTLLLPMVSKLIGRCTRGTRGHILVANYYKKIYHSQKRLKQLELCDKLEDHCIEFRYRPNGLEYLQLKKLNKGKFADL